MSIANTFQADAEAIVNYCVGTKNAALLTLAFGIELSLAHAIVNNSVEYRTYAEILEILE